MYPIENFTPLTKSDIFVLINPKAGKNSSKRFISYLQHNDNQIPFHISKNAGDALETLKKHSEHFTYCIVVGGDGTINQLLPFFVENINKVLCVFPAGSGNGFALETGFGKNFDLLIKDIQIGKTIKMDVCESDGSYAVNILGIGLDGYVASLFHHQEKRGLWKYVMLTTKTFFSFSPFKAKIQAENQVFEDTFWGVAVANVRQFGNHAYIAPMANPYDGKLDLVLVKKIPVYKLPGFIYRLFTKKLRSNEQIQYITTSGPIIIETEYTFGHRDGEPFIVSKKINCNVIPGALQVLKTRL